MPCSLPSQPHCRPLLEDLHSLKTCFSIFLFLLISRQSFQLSKREELVNDTSLCANKKHINYDYQIGQKVFKYDKMLYCKLKTKTTQPFDIHRVHSNSTVTISLRPGIIKRVIVCRTLPYKDPTPL